jgi:hypothetical protein
MVARNSEWFDVSDKGAIKGLFRFEGSPGNQINVDECIAVVSAGRCRKPVRFVDYEADRLVRFWDLEALHHRSVNSVDHALFVLTRIPPPYLYCRIRHLVTSALAVQMSPTVETLQSHLVEHIVVDAEVVRDLVDDGVPHLEDYLLVGRAYRLNGALEQRDLVRQHHVVVVAFC